jgi:hypothetical protein
MYWPFSSQHNASYELRVLLYARHLLLAHSLTTKARAVLPKHRTQMRVFFWQSNTFSATPFPVLRQPSSHENPTNKLTASKMEKRRTVSTAVTVSSGETQHQTAQCHSPETLRLSSQPINSCQTVKLFNNNWTFWSVRDESSDGTCARANGQKTHRQGKVLTSTSPIRQYPLVDGVSNS